MTTHTTTMVPTDASPCDIWKELEIQAITQEDTKRMTEDRKTAHKLDKLVLEIKNTKGDKEALRILHGLVRHSILYPLPIGKVINTAHKTLCN